MYLWEEGACAHPQAPALPSSHDAHGPTSGCVVYVGRAADTHGLTSGCVVYVGRAADAHGLTFGCVVYVGRAAILQLHRLPILKGEGLCKESNASPSLELWSWRALGAARPPSTAECGAPHLSVPSPGGCTPCSRPPAGTLALQEASLLGTWKQRSGPGWQRSTACLPALVHLARFGRCL